MGFIYIWDKDSSRPLKAINYYYKDLLWTNLRISYDLSVLALGFNNGSYQIKILNNPKKSLEVNMHDYNAGKLSSVIVDRNNKYCLSAD